MLFLISPAKTLDMDSQSPIAAFSQPQWQVQTEQLLSCLQGYSATELSELMGISPKLAVLNYQRYQSLSFPFSQQNAKQAIFAFHGEVYEGLSAETLSVEQIAYLQKHLWILSGLYGLLKPLDLMQAYRLEMGTKLATSRGRDLYEFWGDLLRDALVQQLAEEGHPVIVNLASTEYAKSAKLSTVPYRVVTPIFQDEKAGAFKTISFYAKKARGMMVGYAAQHAISDVESLKQFDADGYVYCESCSSADQWVFRRSVIH